MKNIFKLFLAAAIIFTTNSCEEDLVIFDPVNGQELLGFNSGSYNLPIEINSTGTVQVTVDVSNVSTSDRTYTINVVAEETTVDASVYTLPSSVTIPARW